MDARTPAAANHTDAEAAVDFEFEALAEARNYRRLLMAEFAPYLSGDVLEVGAGIGQCTALLRDMKSVRSITALEPDERYAVAFRQHSTETPVIVGTTSDLAGKKSFDAIVCINVLEHIEDDRGELARHAAMLRERRGHLCLLVPAGPEIYAPIDKDFGHFRRYRRAELRARLEEAGFDVVRLRAYNFVGYLAWWFTFRVLGARRFVASRVRIFDRLIFPWVNFLERRICAPPFGQSVHVIARARAARS